MKEPGLRTKAIHGGEIPDPITRASSPNLVMSTSFLTDPDASFSVEGMDESSYFYTRWGNPTVRQLEQKLSSLENAEDCIAFASGMAAASNLFLHLLEPGDQLILSDVSYAAVSELSNHLLPKLGVDVLRINLSDPENLKKAITPKTKLVYAETPCNPILRLTPLAEIAEILLSSKVPLVVDSTFATPISTKPLELGADYVIHSLSKYIGGHGDAIGGAVLGKKERLDRMRIDAIRNGGVLSPFNAWLILRGAATLPLRMKAHEENAFALAKKLEEHPKILQVTYPGLPSHPQHELAKSQMKNFSGMVTFRTQNPKKLAKLFSEKLKYIHYAVSLGHHRSLIFYLSTDEVLKDSFRLSPAEEAEFRKYAEEGIFRFSVGLEDPDDLWEDLESVLELL
ncbi:trans-sulfuration enzyme family protein [Leptospira wolffii]|uniref:Trans-sulfuration enzyme family protein n=1 Tax=Leptospira wolffii TaxID=409998 RepID=A0ABV5BR03_9LEPT